MCEKIINIMKMRNIPVTLYSIFIYIKYIKSARNLLGLKVIRISILVPKFANMMFLPAFILRTSFYAHISLFPSHGGVNFEMLLFI